MEGTGYPEDFNDSENNLPEDFEATSIPQTVKERQETLNKSHLFGIKIWKPALYPKHRSIDTHSYQDLHEQPGSKSTRFISTNIIWPIFFGWWLAYIYVVLALALCPVWFVGVAATNMVKPSSRFYRYFKETRDMKRYVFLLFNLSGYVFWPFGKFIAKAWKVSGEAEPLLNNLNNDEERFGLPPSALNEDELGYETFGAGTSRGRPEVYEFDADEEDSEQYWFIRLFLKYWHSSVSAFIFFVAVFCILGPIHIYVSALCYFLILPIPMGKLNYYLLRYLLHHPLLLSAHNSQDLDADPSATPQPSEQENFRHHSTYLNGKKSRAVFYWRNDATEDSKKTDDKKQHRIFPTIMATPTMRPTSGGNLPRNAEYQVVLCIYRGMSLEYLRYTAGGVNIIFINLLSMIFFTIFDFYVLGPMLGFTGIASKSGIFFAGILSTIPLAYFIGMAVSSITATTGSVAVGAVINATFGSIIEIILYAFGLMEGKEELVQGAMIGSFLCGLLALPGASMFSGGLKRSEQRFNAKSAGVTSTMLVVAVIGVFTPTIFQNIHGSFLYDCVDCPENWLATKPGSQIIMEGSTCRSCRVSRPHPTDDPIYLSRTRPLMYLCAFILVFTYLIGLWFTLRTHRHRIYPKRAAKKKVRHEHRQESISESKKGKAPLNPKSPILTNSRSEFADETSSVSSAGTEHGHDNPGWGLVSSTIILLGCTFLYALIAEILIDCMDDILEIFPMSEKTIGLTLFAIVPSVTEFYNAIAFAANGNIVLSLEIGSAYAIQVALVQIPALVCFSAIWNSYGSPRAENVNVNPGRYLSRISNSMMSFAQSQPVQAALPKRSEFTLVFPQWEFYTIVFSVFLLTYMYMEGKSNYFKGALLLLSYIILIVAFFLEPVIQ